MTRWPGPSSAGCRASSSRAFQPGWLRGNRNVGAPGGEDGYQCWRQKGPRGCVRGAARRIRNAWRRPDRPYGDLALTLYEELGHRAAQSTALNNLAVRASSTGRPQALGLLDRAELAAHRRATSWALVVPVNIGDVLLHPGALAEARNLLATLWSRFCSPSGRTTLLPSVRAALGSPWWRRARSIRGWITRASPRAAGRIGQGSRGGVNDALVAEALLGLGQAKEAETLAAMPGARQLRWMPGTCSRPCSDWKVLR